MLYVGRVLCLCLFTVTLVSQPASAADWGTLKGRFVYDGKPPVAEKLAIVRAAVCEKNPPVDEELVVHPENRGVANVIVTLEVKKGDPDPSVHPSYSKTEKAKVRMTNENCRFVPRVTTLRTTQTLVIGNDDPIPHNTLGYVLFNTPFNDTIASETEIEKQLKKPERRPAMVKCTIHAWMKCWLVVRDHPYVAVTDKDGRFEIRDLPAGDWTFQFWQEKAGYLSRIDIGGKVVEDRKGLYQLPIEKEEVDLGEIRLSPALFE